MTKHLPHVAFSVSSIRPVLITYLQSISSQAPAWEAWVFGTLVPAIVGVISWIRQEQGKGLSNITISDAKDLVDRVGAVETAVKSIPKIQPVTKQ